ncbi:MAG: sigma-70 family RNA polymerase sigma factor [Candidatus Ornithospirochaeta sp.]|nr:sigma-70 family RNA polymerase sigma factor [Candidatus Ornithospirochaeta sp.]
MEQNAVSKEMMENDNEVLSLYLNEINRIPLLSYEDEYELAVKAKNGDKAARERIINSNLRFVVSVAKKYRGQGLPLSDLINEGNIGLIVALDKFDPDKGYHFISYAVWWINQSIMKALSDKGRAVRLPLNRTNELMQIQKAQKKLMHDRETADPSVEDIAELTGLDSRLVSDLMQISSDMISFDSPVKKNDDSDSTFGDFIEDQSKGPEEQVMDTCLKEDVRSLLSVLTDKERGIISMRYGLDGNKPMSLKEIGERYALTKERIRQIEKRALEKLRIYSEEKDLGSYSAAV